MDHIREVPRHLVERAGSDPDAIDLEEIEDLLDDDWEEMRNTGLKVLVGLATDDPNRVVPFVDDVIDCLDESYGIARSHAALVLSLLADDHPDLVGPAIPTLIDNLDDPTPLYRYRAARAIARQSQSTPESFVEHADALIDTLIDGPSVSKPEPATDAGQREIAQTKKEQLEPDFMRSAATKEVVANVLVEVAREDASVCSKRLSDLLPVLSDDESVPHARGAIVEVIRHVVVADPDTLDVTIDPLLGLLDDDATFVRARAIRALGFAEATEAVDPLRTVAESDPDEDVRELAVETADWLEENV